MKEKTPNKDETQRMRWTRTHNWGCNMTPSLTRALELEDGNSWMVEFNNNYAKK